MLPRTIPLPKRPRALPKLPGNLAKLGKGVGQNFSSARRPGGTSKTLKRMGVAAAVVLALFVLVALTMGISPTPETLTTPLTIGQGA